MSNSTRIQAVCNVASQPKSKTSSIPSYHRKRPSVKISNNFIAKKKRGEGKTVNTRYSDQQLSLPYDSIDFNCNYVIQPIVTAQSAVLFPDHSILRNTQIIGRLQNFCIGMLHCLLSHPGDILLLMPNIDTTAFPPSYSNVISGMKKSWTEREKKVQLSSAKQYYAANPDKLDSMLRNEAKLTIYLRNISTPSNFVAHQFYKKDGRTKLRILFTVRTITGDIRILCICLLCGQEDEAILHRSIVDGRMLFESFELATLFLLHK